MLKGRNRKSFLTREMFENKEDGPEGIGAGLGLGEM